MEARPVLSEDESEQGKFPTGIDCSEAHFLRDKIRTDALHAVAANFNNSIQQVSFLLITPHILASSGYARAAAFGFFHKFAKTESIRGRTFDEYYDQLKSQVENARKDPEAQQAWLRHLGEVSLTHISELEADPHTGPALRAISMAALAFGWTAFEVMASDAWEALLNAYPMRFGHPAFKGIAEDERGDPDISSKQVAVGFLAKYDFDLRNKLGTALRPKFDFTSLAGIRKAYRAAFGTHVSQNRVFESAELAELEALRHLIVHRAGVVDEEFRARTKCATALGLPAPLEHNRVRGLLQSVVVSGCTLLLSMESMTKSENTEPASS